MISKPFKFKARPWELRTTPSVCSLCAAQCQVDFHSKQGKILRVTSEDNSTVNNGNLCVGGFFGHDFLNSEERLTAPLIKQSEATWDDALGTVAAELGRIRDAAGGQAIAGLASARLCNEEAYLFQKLFRTALNSNNIDSELRFGLLRAIKVLHAQLQLTGGSNPLDRIGQAQGILVFGSDLSTEAPAIDWQVQLAHRKRDAKLVFASPCKTKLADQAETFLQYRPGSEAHLAGALAKLILEKGLADQAYLQRYLANKDELASYLQNLDLEAAVAATGIERALLEEAADHLGQAASVALVFGREVTAARFAEQAVAALANLALVSGALHGDQGGMFPVDEKGNAFGLLDAGVCPEFLPGLQSYPEAKAKFAEAWHASLPEGGADANAILAGIEQGSIKALYLVGINPLISFPESTRWRKALGKLDFLVVQDLFANDLTALADVVLPGAATPEKRGSLTALDGRINTLRRAVEPPGTARPDLAILADLFAALSGKPAPSEAAVQTELLKLSGLYPDACQNLLSERKFCWKQAYSPAEKSLSAATPELAEPATAELLLMVGKDRFQFGTITSYGSATSEVSGQARILINPADAEKLNVANQGARLKVTGPAGSAVGTVKITTQVPPGLLFAAYNQVDLNIQQTVSAGSNCIVITAAKA